METYLRGRVRNYNLKPKNCLLPLYEAVMNAIQAVEDRTKSDSADPSTGEIRITFSRAATGGELFEGATLPAVVGVEVADNGTGFDDRHLSAFRRLDDDFRLSAGGKGVGRVSWLPAFDHVEVESRYLTSDGHLRARCFGYSIDADGIRDLEESDADAAVASPGATVKLQGLKIEFQNAWPKKPQTVLDRLAVHFQRYLTLPTCPSITIVDPALERPISLVQYFREQFLVDRDQQQITIGTERFDVVHLLHRASGDPSEQRHFLAMLADGRPAEDPQPIPAGYGIPRGAIKDDGQSLYYIAFVSSRLFDLSANDKRTHLDLAPTNEGLYSDEVSRDRILTEVAKSGRAFLGDRLKALYEDLRKRIKAICEREIRYRPLLVHRDAELSQIEPSLSDARLEDAVHGIYRDYMAALRDRTRNISKRAALHIEDLIAFKAELKEILSSWNEAAMSDLAAYVADRRAILWFLDARLKLNDQSKYRFEEAIHAVFFPMGFDTDGYPVDAANLWLIDERMAFHDYLASDIALKDHKTLETSAAGEPDIAIYQAAHAFGVQPMPRNSITLVEFKRPGRDDYTVNDNPYSQAIDYIDDIRSGTAKFRDGRPIADTRSIQFFVYIVCDHSKSLQKTLLKLDFHETSDGRGYFKHVPAVNAYFEVVSFDKLIDDAVVRNKVLFDKLNLPSSAGGDMPSADSTAPQ
jgi:hypothetical protein